jgi:phosphoserine phosphatase RsbU/P
VRTPPHILIVDDNPENLDILQTRLTRHGYEILTARDGEEALAAAREKLPDLILLDIMMPKMDGIEVCRRLKADRSLPFMPIIMVTARADSKDIVRGLEAGGDEYLTKPVDQAALVARIKSMLRIKDLHDTVQEQAARLEAQAAELLGWNRALDAEFEKGKQIQKEFLPHELPRPTGWDIAAYFHAARQVSGDFYDAFILPNGCLVVVIGDVCDKGIGSALFMALIRSLIRVFTGKISLGGVSISPGDQPTTEAMDVEVGTALGAITLTSEYIAREHSDQGMFATLCLGIINPETGELSYVNAGHLPLLIIGKSGVRASLSVTGPSVGIAPGLKFRGAMARIEPGEMLCGYTDGVTEAMSPNEVLYTKERFFALLENPASSAHELIGQIKTDLFSHVVNAPQSDDITMIAVHRQPLAK